MFPQRAPCSLEQQTADVRPSFLSRRHLHSRGATPSAPPKLPPVIQLQPAPELTSWMGVWNPIQQWERPIVCTSTRQEFGIEDGGGAFSLFHFPVPHSSLQAEDCVSGLKACTGVLSECASERQGYRLFAGGGGGLGGIPVPVM